VRMRIKRSSPTFNFLCSICFPEIDVKHLHLTLYVESLLILTIFNTFPATNQSNIFTVYLLKYLNAIFSVYLPAWKDELIHAVAEEYIVDLLTAASENGANNRPCRLIYISF
jgi:hypothetical protein